MKARVLLILMGVSALAFAAVAWADFLPLIHSRPTRDNSFDPASHPRQLEAPPAPTATPTSVCGSPTDPSTFGFEGGIGGWAESSYQILNGSENGAASTVSPFVGTTGGAEVCDGVGSLCGTADFIPTGGNTAVQVTYSDTFATPLTYCANATLNAEVHFPAGMSSSGTDTGVKLYVQTGGLYAYYSGTSVNVPSGGGWVPITLSMNAAYLSGGSTASAVANADDVDVIGISIYAPSGAVSASADTVCLDVLNIVAGPTPTATPNYTGTPTFTISPTFTLSPTFTVSPNVTATPTFTASQTPTPIPTFTPGGACGSLTDTSNVAGFEPSEGGIGDWTSTVYTGYTTATLFQGTTTSTEVCEGVGSLCGTVNYTGAATLMAFAQNFSPGLTTWTARVLSGEVLFPAGMSGATAQFIVKTTAYTAYSGSAVDAPANGGWEPLTLNMSTVTNADNVLELDVQFSLPAGAPAGSYTFCTDSLSLSAAPTPTITPTATLTETPGGTPATATPTPTPIFTPGGPCGVTTDASTIAGFEGSTDGWTYQTYTGYTPATMFQGTVPDLQVCEGSGSLCGTAAYTGSGTTVEYCYDPASPYLTITATAIITAEALFPPGMGNTLAQLYVKVGSGYTQYTASGGSAPANVPANGGWIQLSLNLGAAYETNAGSPVPVPSTGGMVTAEEIGMDIDQLTGASSGTFTVCLDAVSSN